jgi:hypothetical protein
MARTQAEAFLAALAQQVVRDAEPGADCGQARERFGLEQVLKSGKNAAVPASGECFLLYGRG